MSAKKSSRKSAHKQSGARTAVTVLLLCLVLIFPLGSCDALPEPLRSIPAVAQLSDALHDAADRLDSLSRDISRSIDDLLNWFYGEPTPEIEEGSTFAVHFIDVGQADCALVACDGEYMLIDGGNKGDADLVYSYLTNRGIERLEYLVGSHAHEDHMGGLPGAVYAAEIGTALCPVSEGDSVYFSDVVEALDKQGKTLTVPKAGDTFELGSAQITVLGPLEEYDEVNDTSLVLMVDYGATSFLFTGDMEQKAETDLVEAGLDLSATVLKVGHHGSSSSTSYRFLREVMPEYAVISVGEDNKYGHPHDKPLSRLRDAGVVLFRTDRLGHVVATTDGTEIQFTWENQNASPEDAEPADPAQLLLYGNKKSKVFHTWDCKNLPGEQNRVEFTDYDAAIAEGFKPCGSCIG